MARATYWVQVNRDKTDLEDNESADCTREIFLLSADGTGAKQIALAMNKHDRTMSEGVSFSEERLGKILRDRCLIGEKTFKSWRVAKGYFPRVICTKLCETIYVSG